jgi:hypothetical protein
MKRALKILIASGGVFIGSLLSDIVLGDGIQADDMSQAALVALVAAAIQMFLTRPTRPS